MKFSNYKYLVIEDDTNVWDNIKRRMNKFNNWEACGFCDELDNALEKVKENKPQLIFSDWSIKNGNAYEILNYIKNETDYFPYVIFFTGYQSEHPEIPQEVINNYSFVKKYLVKPIFENLTENLQHFVSDAEEQFFLTQRQNYVFIENKYKQKFKISPVDFIAFTQSCDDPRLKILHLNNQSAIQIKYTWKKIIDFLDYYRINYLVTNHRKSIVNKEYIIKISKPYIHLKGDLKIEVARENWVAIE